MLYLRNLQEHPYEQYGQQRRGETRSAKGTRKSSIELGNASKSRVHEMNAARQDSKGSGRSRPIKRSALGDSINASRLREEKGPGPHSDARLHQVPPQQQIVKQNSPLHVH